MVYFYISEASTNCPYGFATGIKIKIRPPKANAQQTIRIVDEGGKGLGDIDIKLLSTADIDGLFEFEKENRRYFESIGLARCDSYYDRASFSQIISDLVAEQEQGVHYMYLVLNSQGSIVGRVNFAEVEPFPFQKAELGYRIGKDHQGKGYATVAVGKALKAASSIHNLHRIEAGTSPQNIASQIVLIKNGFQFVGKYNQYIFQGDKWVDSLQFEKVLDAKE